MNRKIRVLVAAAAAVTFMAMGSVSASAHEEYYGPYALAYSYTLYADAEKTVVIGYKADTCSNGAANHPYISTPYYDEAPVFVCGEMGPYMPTDWPY